MSEPISPKPSRANLLARSAMRLIAPLIALVVIAAVFTLKTPAYISRDSLVAIGEQAAIIVIVGIGQTFVIIAGGIDLSVGSVVAFGGTVAAVANIYWHWSPLAAAAAGVLSGGLIGLFNGVTTVKTKLHPFIITLGSMMIFRGLALALTNAQSTTLLPPEFVGIATGHFPLSSGKEVYVPVILLLYIVVIGAVAHVILSRTRTGRYCFAIGSNAASARLSGIRVDAWNTLYFVAAGLLFGFGGVVQVARIGLGDPKVGEGMELEAIAAAVIGGCSLSGGQGSVLGTILGALLMAALRQGLSMINLESYWQQVALGAAIILAVIYDRASRARGE